MLSIYNYINANEYLSDKWKEKRFLNPHFSLRAWAGQLDINNHTSLHQMLQGKRGVPKKYIFNFAKSLSLDVKETLYFEAMVDLSRSKSLEEKEVYTLRLKELSPKPKLQMKEIEIYRLIKSPLHTIILELSSLKGFKSDPVWIKKALRISSSVVEIKEVIERLESLGLITFKGESFKKSQQHLYSRQDISDKGLQEYHKKVCTMAAEQISEQDVNEREYNAYALNIERQKIPKAKELIRKFMDEFATEVEAQDEQGEETYQLNIQFFSITNVNKGVIQ